MVPAFLSKAWKERAGKEGHDCMHVYNYKREVVVLYVSVLISNAGVLIEGAGVEPDGCTGCMHCFGRCYIQDRFLKFVEPFVCVHELSIVRYCFWLGY